MGAARVVRPVLGALGVAVLGYGAFGLFTDPSIKNHASVEEWLIWGLVAHDAILAPVVFTLCAVAYRLTGVRWRGRLAALSLIGGSLVLIAVPALLRRGHNPNPTVLPLDYARNLGLLLAVLVAAMAVYGGIDAARRRHRQKAAARRAVVAAEAEAAAATAVTEAAAEAAAVAARKAAGEAAAAETAQAAETGDTDDQEVQGP
jgi:hypothetical protein